MRTPVAHRIARSGRRALLIAPLLLAAACASAEKRYQQGTELEARGRPADAAERYIDALRKDGTLQEARVRLQESGDRAMADYLTDAETYTASGRPREAADVLLRLDELHGRARVVGVTLALPADYHARRRAAFDRAITSSIQDATYSADRGDFGQAVGWLERAAGRWEPTPAQRGELDRARYDVHVTWAQAELSNGRFRAAYERAGRAVDLFGRDAAAAALALRVQEEAVRLGTVTVAVLPVGARSDVRRELPDDFFPELDEELEMNRWREAPLFVEVVDLRESGRLARRHGYGRQVWSLTDAARLGRDLGARLVVVAELDSVAMADRDTTATRRPARTRAGVDTAYTVRQGRRDAWARITWRLVDADSRTEVARGELSAEGAARFREAVYAGDYRTLTLNREDRALFDNDAREEAEQELVRELISGLAERLERAILSRVESEVD